MAASIHVMVRSGEKRRRLAHAGIVGGNFFWIEYSWHGLLEWGSYE